MIQATILVSLFLLSSAKIYIESDLDVDYQHEQEQQDVETPTWVLKVDGDLELKLASPDEEEQFKEDAAPHIKNYPKAQHSVPPASQTPSKLEETFVVGIEDIFILLNKFALFTNAEPDSYLSESHDDISLVIFFKYPFTSVVITVGFKQWHFFIRPSPLPSWFFENHQIAGIIPESVKIPEDVKQRFYVSLWHLLRSMLNYPL